MKGSKCLENRVVDMRQQPTDTENSTDGLTPADVRALRPTKQTEHDDNTSPAATKSDLAEILTPETRFLVLDSLIASGGDLMTVSQIGDAAGVSQASVSRHVNTLEEYGVVEQGEKMGNARTYRANVDHPLVQLLVMADNVVRFGSTKHLLDDQFLGEPGADYQPGDHPADDRDE